MNQPNWQQVEEVFGIAVALRGNDRVSFLESVSQQDAILHSEVLSLLSADELAGIMPNSSAANLIIEAEVETQEQNIRQSKQTSGSIIGAVLGGRYLINRRLGGGGMGEVFLAFDQNLMNREVVVKILSESSLKNKEVVRKFYHEIEALARVKDEGIVTIYDSGLYNELPFLVLEYVEGEDLMKIISPLLFSVRDFLNIEKTLEQLFTQQTPVNKHLWQKFKPETCDILFDTQSRIKQAETKPAEIERAQIERAECLRDEFNNLLTNFNLYDEQVFQSLNLSEKTIKLKSSQFAAGKTAAFNRALLEDAFPNEIRRGEDKQLAAAAAADIFQQLCTALSHGHRRKIIHRDLKPPNIMLDEREGRGWRVKLIDFGIAKVRESLFAQTTELSVVMGTPAYMSPEQLQGDSNLTPACDIYTVGLIAFEMLMGKRVFEGKSPIEQHKLQEKEELPELNGLSERYSSEVEQTIRRALSFNPENRYATAQDFGDALAKALVPEKKTTPPEIIENPELLVTKIPDDFVQPPEPPQIEVQPNKKAFPVILAIAACLLLLLTTGGIGYWALTRNKKPDEKAEQIVAPAEIKRSLEYQLVVQKYFEGKPFQQPFKATGDEIFGDDWRFRMLMNSPQNGNLYLLTEGKSEKGENELTMLFPHPQVNNGTSAVSANQPIETGQMKFDKNQGSEKFWIVWAEKPVDELESVFPFVNPQDLGTIKDSDKEKAVRDFLAKYGVQENLTEKADSDKHLKTVKSTSGVLIKLAEFRHN